jgi:tetratricopeptide (TPR) repeat protein
MAKNWRTIRVFISSTFSDMQEEREDLVKRVFPQLRKLCEQRGVVWGEVDLRWGVTDEEKAEGKVLPICLEEIKKCQPYFIGLLGERYGWVPVEIPLDLIQREPWLDERRERSVTELEILHGVLNNPEMADHSFFYLRDPSYIDSLPADRRASFHETPTEEEIQRLGPEEAERRSQDRRQKLAALKQRIRASGLPVRNYQAPRSLQQLVLEDLTSIINELYPPGAEPEPLDREAAEHQAFAASRARVYIGRQEYLDRLDAHAQGQGPPLVVLGESGSGKSALLANWAQEYRGSHQDNLLLMHFIGSSPQSTDWAPMLRRIMGEFKRHFEISQDIPDRPDALRAAFANWLHMAAARGKVILILDGLNQLEDRDGAPDLVWLPPEIPANIRLILSTLPGRSLEELTKRGWPALAVQPLDAGERRSLIKKYLQSTKSLSVDLAERIASASHSANPLYLRVLLEELRVHGDNDTLKQRIAHYLEAATVSELYSKVLRRYEEDYEGNRPGLVRDSMSLLWAARRGLSEAELLDLLGSYGEPLPRAWWSPLFLVAEQSLANRSGLIGFAHNYLRQAIEERYLPQSQGGKAAHLRLADYFQSQDASVRKVEELPWQLARAEAWQRLYDLLGGRQFFISAWEHGQFEVKGYWTQIEENSPLRLVAAYRSVLDDPESDTDFTWDVSLLLGDTGHPQEALELRRHLAQHYRRADDRQGLQRSLQGQAAILYSRGDLEGAMKLHKEAERICRELGDVASLQVSLGNQALILKDRGDLDGAMKLHKEEERICRELGNLASLKASLNNQALILRDRGDPDGAMKLHKEQERICRELGNVDGLATSLGNQAIILYSRGDLDGAMKLHKEEERICRELGNVASLQASLGNQAAILYSRGDLDGAMKLHKEEERICRELGNVASLQASLNNQALILKARGDPDGAVKLYKEGERICRELGNVDGLQTSLGNQAAILYSRGDLDGAMKLHKEEEQICRELGNVNSLSASLGNQAIILYSRGDLDGAMKLHKEEEEICRELGNVASLQASLGGQANILYYRGDLDGAMKLYKEGERICRELGNKDGLAASLGNQALILYSRGDLDGAMKFLEEQGRICRELGNKDGLTSSLAVQALILEARGDPEGAMKLHKEEERICRELGNLASLQASLGNQANILYYRGDLDGAMKLHKEQERICRELGNVNGLSASLGNQALILKAQGDVDGAMKLANEAYHLAAQHGYTALASRLKRIVDGMRR